MFASRSCLTTACDAETILSLFLAYFCAAANERSNTRIQVSSHLFAHPPFYPLHPTFVPPPVARSRFNANLFKWYDRVLTRICRCCRCSCCCCCCWLCLASHSCFKNTSKKQGRKFRFASEHFIAAAAAAAAPTGPQTGCAFVQRVHSCLSPWGTRRTRAALVHGDDVHRFAPRRQDHDRHVEAKNPIKTE